MLSFFFSYDNLRPHEGFLLCASVPLMKLISLTVIGLVLAHPKIRIVPIETFKLLSNLVFTLFLPCLIFNHLGANITFKNFVLWWFIPVNVVLSAVIGSVLGYLVAIICRPPPELFRFTILMTAFGNSGNLPIAIVESVCREDNPFGPDCQDLGVAYVSFAQWVGVILVYTVVYHMMEPPLENYEIVEEEIEIEEQNPVNDICTPLLVEAEWPEIDEVKETVAKDFNNHSSVSQTDVPDLDLGAVGGSNSPKTIRCFGEPRVVRRIRIVAQKTQIGNTLQPPTIASILAIIIGMVPQLKAFFFGYNAPLAFITDGLDILAGATVPSVMLILGGILAKGPNDSKLGLRTTIGITVARLLVLPLVGFGVVTLADKLNFLVHGDQMYKFVLLLQYSTPSAILLGAIASLRRYAVSEASALLFWQHVFALFSLSMYIVIYFKLL